MKLDFLKHLWQKTIFKILVIVTAIILVLAFFVNRYWSPLFADKVKSTVLKSSDGLYHIDFSDVRLHILEGRIALFNVTLSPDTNVYNQRKKAGLAPVNLYEVHIKKLVLKHVHPFQLYFKHKLDISQVIITAPELHITHRPNLQKDTTVKNNLTIYQKISRTLKLVHVGQILLNDIKLRYISYQQNKPAVSLFHDVNLDVEDLLIDSATQFDKQRFLYCKDVQVELNNYEGKSSNGLYHYKVKRVTFSTLTHQLNAYGFSLNSAYKPSRFFEKTYRGRFTAYLDSMQLNKFDIDLYNRKHILKGTNLILTKGSINIFANPRPDPVADKEDRVKTFPNVGIFLLHADFILDTMTTHHIDVIYEELNRKSKKTGFVTFNNTDGRFINVTTDSAALRKNHICNVQLYSSLMNRGKLDVIFSFNLTDVAHSYSYKGTLGPMELSAMNRAIMPLGLLKVNTGKVSRFIFDIHGDRSNARGTVSLQYNDLKVTVLKADTAEKRLKHKILESFYANLMLLKHDNPDTPGSPPRSFNVSFKRPLNYPFFKNVWHTLLIGIKSSVGLDEKTQEKAAQKMAEHEKKKIERKQRKAIRKQKRAARRQKREEKRRRKILEKELKKQNAQNAVNSDAFKLTR